jgi:hypothetical protein
VVNGDLLIATARNPEQLGDLVSTYGERILTVALDVTNPEQARAAIALLVIRGAPALLYRRQVGMRRAVVAGLLQAISLPFIVVAVQIGLALDLLTKTTGAALVAAGLLSILIFPISAITLLRSGPHGPTAAVESSP